MPLSSPSTALYTLQRGICSIGEWDGTTPPTSWTDLGNCPKLEIEVTEEVLDHFSYRTGAKTKDKTVILEAGYSISFDLDEISVANLKLYLKGTLTGQNIIHANKALTKEYALKFIGDSPAGYREKWEFWKCKVSPDGSLSLISDEWMKMSLKGTGLADVANHPTHEYFDVTLGTTTTAAPTTTTTE